MSTTKLLKLEKDFLGKFFFFIIEIKYNITSATREID